MRAISGSQQQTMNRGVRAIHVDVRVYNTNKAAYVSLRNLYGFNFIRAVTYQEEIDDNGKTATITVDRSIGTFSIAPTVQTGRVYADYGQLINLNVPIKIFVALLPFGQTPQGINDPGWLEVFWGRIYAMDWAKNSFTLSCRDWLDQLQSLWVENSAGIIPANPGGVSAATVMQQILNYAAALPLANLQLPTLYSVNGTSATPFLSTAPDNPGWAIKSTDPYPTSVQSIWTALDNINQQIGWCLRQKWNANIGTWALTWYDPARGNTASQFSFLPSALLDISKCELHLGDIRNAVQIFYTYAGSTTNVPSTYPPAVSGSPNYAYDAVSAAKYGRQFMQLGSDATPLINGATVGSLTDFETLAKNAISDLAQPAVDYMVDVMAFPFVELNDVYYFAADTEHFSQDQLFACIGYTTTIDGQTAKTTLSVRGKPSGGVQRWLARQQQNFTKRIGAVSTNNSSDQNGNQTANSSFSQFTRF